MKSEFGIIKLFTILFLLSVAVHAQKGRKEFTPGKEWLDTEGQVINAHGAGFLFENGTYYWFGESRAERSSLGVAVYSSKDLYNWKNEGLALNPVDGDDEHDIARGCVMERPKVIFNEKTGKYVMWFHLEMKGQGYNAARVAVAVADQVVGPYNFVTSYRPNGNMSRDMTVFVDDDGSAYHIYSSRDNYDLRIAKLSDDYLHHTAQDSLMFGEHREAPAIIKHEGLYYLITSGCTGWKPNDASIHVSESLFGNWKRKPSPLRGPHANITFDGQSTYILPVLGKKDAYIFIADRWKPQDLRNSPYIWLPLEFDSGEPIVQWRDSWDLSMFD
ncbi:glycoside hydrolase family 43 protein [Belliella sp. DSM 107340]|uniref:Glycoside hydrolase family 43 protein n=1 Tax=Belliella calami TaxID=2923436 RepID=A0ABS9UN09_9BACT|nr:glycoside hydrolase family 43 protein [Belliella calami]MCH7397800.1 glycoside hydrolase family 43 protein [Belliella calami]